MLNRQLKESGGDEITGMPKVSPTVEDAIQAWYNIDRYYTAPSEASVHREVHTMCSAHGIMYLWIVAKRESF